MEEHEFNCLGRNVNAILQPSITLQEAQEAAQLGNGSIINFGQLTHDLNDIKNLVQTARNFYPNTYTADAPAWWTKKEVFTDGTEVDLRIGNRGIGPDEFIVFWNLELPTGATLANAVCKNLINLMLNDYYGSKADGYTVHCFAQPDRQPNLTPLSGYQPILLTVEQTVIAASGGDVVATVTDGSGGYEYSIDNTNWFNDNTFDGLLQGDYTMYIRDSEGVLQQRNFKVVGEI